MQGIRVNLTPEEKKMCADYCESQGVKVLPGTAFACIIKDGKVKAVSGWNNDTGGAIDPLVSENVSYTKTLAIFMYGFLVAMGYKTISCWTNNDVWAEMLKREGFVAEKTNKLMKGVE